MKIQHMIFLLTFFCFHALAFQVSPMFQLYDAVGSDSKKSYEIFNPNSTELLVQVKVVEMVKDESGEYKEVPAEGNFLVLPPQSRIEPNSGQRFRVRYLGDMPQKTQIYRIEFEQLQTSDFGNKPGVEVKVLFSFSTVAFVSPLDCTSALNATIENGSLVLQNPGNCVYDMSESQFQLSGPGGETTVGWAELETGSGGYLMPDIRAVVEFPEKLRGYSAVNVVGD